MSEADIERIKARRAVAAQKQELASGQERCELRKGLRIAMSEVRELRDACRAQAKALLKAHNNFRAMKGRPPHKLRERLDDTRFRKLLEIERLWLR